MTAQEQAVTMFGAKAQINKVLSEMHELQGRLRQALVDIEVDGKIHHTTKYETLDEFVDVGSITLPQLSYIFGFTQDEINKKIVEKQCKLENCLRGDHAG